MASSRSKSACTLAVAAAATALVLPAGASAAVSCDFNAGTAELGVEVTAGTSLVYLSRAAGPSTDVLVDTDNDVTNGTVACGGGTPTLSTTGEVNVDETGSAQGTYLIQDFARGRLEPGLGAETGSAEIEVSFDTDGDGKDAFEVYGVDETLPQSFRFGTSGPDIGGELNGDDDGDDVTLVDVEHLIVAPGEGGDTVTADGTGSTNFGGASTAEFSVFGSVGNDVMVVGNASQSHLTGGEGNDTMTGGPGPDSFHIEEGNDSADGAGGSGDFASYENHSSATGVTLDLSQTEPQDTGDQGTDQVRNIENVVGSNGSDRLTGTDGANVLFGGNGLGDAGDDVLLGLDGADTLNARSGDDVLIGGQGNDTLRGEPGVDTASFAFGSTAAVTFSLDLALTEVAQATGGAGSDTLADSSLDGDTDHDVENLAGSPFGDTLTGNTLANRIEALDGLLDTIDCVAAGDGDEAVADEAGIDVISNCETVDTAPQTAVLSGPADGAAVNDRTPAYSLGADEAASFEYRVDGGSFQACAASCEVSALGDGTHILAFRAVDADENGSADQTPVTRALTVDATPPETTLRRGKRIKKGPDAKGRFKNLFVLGSSEPGSGFACTVDGKARACSAGLSVKLGPGRHRITATATDALGNQDPTPASLKVRIKGKRR